MLIPRPVNTQLMAIPDGANGIKATLKLMSRIVQSEKKTFPVRNTALFLTRGLLQKDYMSEINALYKYVRDEIRYVRDINGIETVQTPEMTMSLGAGDCDDKSTLLAALLESIGFSTRFVAVGPETDYYVHVFVEVKNPRSEEWISLETTEPVNIGWKPRFFIARIIQEN